MDFLQNFRSRETEQLLSPVEVAKAIRDTTLDLAVYGTTGSDQRVPLTPDKKAVKIDHLLGYSRNTLLHYRTLLNVLSAPHSFTLKAHKEGEEDENGDVLHQLIDGKHNFIFANGIDDPYLRGLQPGTNPEVQSSGILDVNIFQMESGIWRTMYYYALPTIDDPAKEENLEQEYQRHKNGFSQSLSFPERNLLLSFVYSPVALTGNDIFHNPELFRRGKDCLTDKKGSHLAKFKAYNAEFDAQKMVEFFKTQKNPNEFRHYIYSLEKDGNRTFQIVELGQREIGNQNYHIYSGAEQSLSQERVTSPTGVTQQSPQHSTPLVTVPNK